MPEQNDTHSVEYFLSNFQSLTFFLNSYHVSEQSAWVFCSACWSSIKAQTPLLLFWWFISKSIYQAISLLLCYSVNFISYNLRKVKTSFTAELLAVAFITHSIDQYACILRPTVPTATDLGVHTCVTLKNGFLRHGDLSNLAVSWCTDAKIYNQGMMSELF